MPFKRIFDVSASILDLIIISPILLIVALFFKLLMPGPVFFIQTRIGKGGREFRLLKFRTMRVKPKTSEGSFDAGDQSRISALMKETRLREFHECWKQLKKE